MRNRSQHQKMFLLGESVKRVFGPQRPWLRMQKSKMEPFFWVVALTSGSQLSVLFEWKQKSTLANFLCILYLTPQRAQSFFSILVSQKAVLQQRDAECKCSSGCTKRRWPGCQSAYTTQCGGSPFCTSRFLDMRLPVMNSAQSIRQHQIFLSGGAAFLLQQQQHQQQLLFGDMERTRVAFSYLISLCGRTVSPNFNLAPLNPSPPCRSGDHCIASDTGSTISAGTERMIRHPLVAARVAD